MAFSNQIGITGTGDTVIPLELASSHILGFEEETHSSPWLWLDKSETSGHLSGLIRIRLVGVISYLCPIIRIDLFTFGFKLSWAHLMYSPAGGKWRSQSAANLFQSRIFCLFTSAKPLTRLFLLVRVQGLQEK